MSDLDVLLAGYKADLVAVKAARDVLRPEWDSLLNQQLHIEELIRGIKRGRGELYYAHYWQHRGKYSEECDTLEDARNYLSYSQDMGELSPIGIVGPGVTLEDDWETP